jgi:hypothetical protein
MARFTDTFLPDPCGPSVERAGYLIELYASGPCGVGASLGSNELHRHGLVRREQRPGAGESDTSQVIRGRAIVYGEN